MQKKGRKSSTLMRCSVGKPTMPKVRRTIRSPIVGK